VWGGGGGVGVWGGGVGGAAPRGAFGRLVLENNSVLP
jgi:hypothetical protein